MHERRVLSRIEHELTREDPLLATRLARLGPTRGRPRTGWLRAATSMRLRRGLIAALATLTGLSIVLIGRLSSPGIGHAPGQEIRVSQRSCQTPGAHDPNARCSDERPPDAQPYDPPPRPYSQGRVNLAP